MAVTTSSLVRHEWGTQASLIFKIGATEHELFLPKPGTLQWSGVGYMTEIVKSYGAFYKAFVLGEDLLSGSLQCHFTGIAAASDLYTLLNPKQSGTNIALEFKMKLTYTKEDETTVLVWLNRCVCKNVQVQAGGPDDFDYLTLEFENMGRATGTEV